MITENDIREIESTNKTVEKHDKMLEEFLHSVLDLIRKLFGDKDDTFGKKEIGGYTIERINPWYANDSYGVIYKFKSLRSCVFVIRRFVIRRWTEYPRYGYEKIRTLEIREIDMDQLDYIKAFIQIVKQKYDDSYLQDIMKEL